MKSTFSYNNLIFFLLTGMLLVALKVYTDQAAVESLTWMLSPVTFFVELSTGLNFVWVEGSGYFNETKQILINKGCAGITYLLIAIGLAVFTVIPFFKQIKGKMVAFLGLLLLSYCLAVFANASRIITATFLLGLRHKVPFVTSELFHLLIGMVVYLTLLIAYYNFLNWAPASLSPRPDSGVGRSDN